MATSDGIEGCLLRGRSQSDPNILTESTIDLVHSAGKINYYFIVWIFYMACRYHSAMVVKRHHLLPNGILGHYGIMCAPASNRLKENIDTI